MPLPREETDPVLEGARPSLRVRVSRGMLVGLAGQAGAQLLRLVGNLVLARLLFPEAFGLMAIVYLVIFAMEQIANLGISPAILRMERAEAAAFLDTAWTIQVVRGLALWLVGVALAPLVAGFYREPELAAILPVASFASVLIGVTSTKLIVLTRRLDLMRRVAIELSGQGVALVAMIAIAWRHRSVWALVLGGLANQATIALLSHLAIPGARNRLAWDREAARSMASIGKWVFASSGLSFVLGQLDIALLGRLVSPGVLGVYSMGAIIPNLLRDVLFRLSNSVLAPAIAESSRESPSALRARYLAARRVTLPAALVMALAAAVLAPAFFGYLYDERYVDAGWITQLALLRFWFAHLQVTSCLTLLSMGDARPWVVSNLVGIAGVGVGCLLGFELAGLPGLLLGVALGTAASFVVPALQLHRLGVASPLLEVEFTALGAGLAALALGAAWFSGAVVPIADPKLRTLVVGLIAIAPLALWVTGRVASELRFS
jgi:O-antigen/teichoic acid export membrane protein